MTTPASLLTRREPTRGSSHLSECRAGLTGSTRGYDVDQLCYHGVETEVIQRYFKGLFSQYRENWPEFQLLKGKAGMYDMTICPRHMIIFLRFWITGRGRMDRQGRKIHPHAIRPTPIEPDRSGWRWIVMGKRVISTIEGSLWRPGPR